MANLRAAFNLTLASRTLALGAGVRSVRLKPSRKLVGKPRKAFKLRVRLVASDAAGRVWVDDAGARGSAFSLALAGR